MSDSKPNSVPSGDEPIAPPGAADVNALLDQAAQLAAEAAGELGAAELRSESVQAPADERPTSEQVERTLDQVSELVAEANREAAGFAAGSAASGIAQVASVAPSPVPAAALASVATPATTHPPITRKAETAPKPAAAAPVDGPESIAASSATHGTNATAPEAAADSTQSAVAAAPQAAAAAPSAAGLRLARAKAVAARLPRLMVVAPLLAVIKGLNAPFERFGDHTRFAAGVVAIGTLMFSAVFWLYPVMPSPQPDLHGSQASQPASSRSAGH